MRVLLLLLVAGLAVGPAEARVAAPSPAFVLPGVSVPVPVQGRKLIRGPRGGCYYINRNGNKTYVDRSLCKG